VTIAWPDGRATRSDDGNLLNQRLSATFGRAVALAAASESSSQYEYHWPDLPGLLYQGRYYRDEVAQYNTPPGTFFDSSSLHLLSTASLIALEARLPGSRIEPARFRPNFVIDTRDATGFVENDWVGRVLRIGKTVRLRITKPCIRCVMVTLEQSDLPADQAVLKAAFEHNGGNLGVKAEVETPGPVRVGDKVVLD